MGYWVEKVECTLSNWFNREAVLTKRATTALYLLFQTFKKSKIYLPAISCTSPANAALYAGLELKFLDIDKNTLNMDIKLIPNNAEVIMPIHLYGNIFDMDKLLNDGIIIEDAAQVFGSEAICHDKACATLLSFGHSKILDIGFGGALLLKDSSLAETIRGKRSYLTLKSTEKLSREYRKVYYNFQKLSRMNDNFNILFTHLPYIYKDIYINAITEEEAKTIYYSLDLSKLKLTVSMRREKYECYKERLQHPLISIPQQSEYSVPWRFTFLINCDDVVVLSDKLRDMGIDVSNWYPALPKWYNDSERYPNADYLEKHVVNLWLDESIDFKTIVFNCNKLIKLLDRKD